ncbi:MAG: fimbrillin family protein [Dysgonamonadaceae bacterium]|jgi:hypothetical protein|nr:fimbrillin family protein [Dysgonamonadaceae bacterium]
MIRNIIIAILISLALVSCSEEDENLTGKEENLPENAIGFTDYQATDSSLRSTGDLTNSNLSSMTVYAHYTGTDDFSASSTPNFMFNQSVTKGGGAWTYSPTRYWPMPTEKVSFFAISHAPGTAGIATVNSYTGYPSFTVTPPATPTQQQDICVASAMNLTKASNSGKVSLPFKHTLSKISFSARYVYTYNNEPVDVYITRITFSGVRGSGALSLTNNDFSWNVSTTTTANYEISSANGELVTSRMLHIDETGDDVVSTPAGTLYLLPQTTPAGATITVTYKIYNIEYTAQMPIESNQWLTGSHHAYELRITADGKIWNLPYTGAEQEVTLPQTGNYQLECWGAQGGNGYSGSGGKGGHIKGNINLTFNDLLYIYVGGDGEPLGSRPNGGAGGWNAGGGAGGKGGNGRNTNWYGGGGGGGATDIRTTQGDVNSRLIVAGGGGGGGANSSPNGGKGGEGDGQVVGADGAAGYGAALNTPNASGGGGGGWAGGQGGNAAASISGRGGSNGYDNSKVTSVTSESGIREGKGYARIQRLP